MQLLSYEITSHKALFESKAQSTNPHYISRLLHSITTLAYQALKSLI